jgi:hypothetical protein
MTNRNSSLEAFDDDSFRSLSPPTPKLFQHGSSSCPVPSLGKDRPGSAFPNDAAQRNSSNTLSGEDFANRDPRLWTFEGGAVGAEHRRSHIASPPAPNGITLTWDPSNKKRTRQPFDPAKRQKVAENRGNACDVHRALKTAVGFNQELQVLTNY